MYMKRRSGAWLPMKECLGSFSTSSFSNNSNLRWGEGKVGEPVRRGCERQFFMMRWFHSEAGNHYPVSGMFAS